MAPQPIQHRVVFGVAGSICKSLPRVCGGEPFMSTPRIWPMTVYPAHAGVNHTLSLQTMTLPCLPRVRGGEPEGEHPTSAAKVSAPRARG